MTVHPEDLKTAVGLWQAMAAAGAPEAWSGQAGTLEWSCLRTMDHTTGALLAYAGSLASRATDYLPRIRGEASADLATGVVIMSVAADVLAEVVRAAPPEVRGHHDSGMSDAEGFVGMALAELLIHGDDVAAGLGVPWQPPAELCERLRDRLFPWAPTDQDTWQTIRWSCGRAALPDIPQLPADWYWHSPPLSEWDGTRTLRG